MKKNYYLNVNKKILLCSYLTANKVRDYLTQNQKWQLIFRRIMKRGVWHVLKLFFFCSFWFNKFTTYEFNSDNSINSNVKQRMLKFVWKKELFRIFRVLLRFNLSLNGATKISKNRKRGRMNASSWSRDCCLWREVGSGHWTKLKYTLHFH